MMRLIFLLASVFPLASGLVAVPPSTWPSSRCQFPRTPSPFSAISPKKCGRETYSGTNTVPARPRFTAAAASASSENDESAPLSAPAKPKAVGTLNVATVVGAGTAAALIQRALTSDAPRLFKQHVTGAALGTLLFLPAAVGSVRSRVDSVNAMKGGSATAKDRRETLLNHIYAHFYLTYAAAISAAVSLASIFRHKARMDKAHFSSLHSRVGLAAVALWAASYAVAQVKVWTPMIKRREFKYDPNLLWASRWHRALGTAAAAMSLGAAAAGVGLSAWGRGAFGPAAASAILAGVAVIEAYILLPSIRERRQRAKRRQKSKKSA